MKTALLHSPRAAAAALALLSGSQVRAGLLGYWNFDGPPSATTSDRLKDLSGNNYHGNDRNFGGGTGPNRVLFNNMDIPHAPFLAPPGNENYCLDLTGADRYVIMEGSNTNGGAHTNIAAPGAVDTRGDAFNIGNSSALNKPFNAGKLTVSFWFKGLPNSNWSNFVAKGGEAFGTPGIPLGTWEGWAVRRFSSNNRIAFTTRNFGALTANGDGDTGFDFLARSGGVLATPQLGSVTFPTATGIYSDNHAPGVWQHFACVWDGAQKHWYVNGFHCRSEVVTGGFAVGTMSRLCFGADENPNTGVIGAGPRFSRTRLDEIAIWDEALSPAQIEDLARGADPRKPLRNSIRPFDFAWPEGTKSSQFSFYPSGQGAAAAIDGNLTNKYWNAAGNWSGLIVTNASATARSFVITTAPDFPDRDPASYEIWGLTGTLNSPDNSGGRGSASAGDNWTLLGAGTLPVTTGRSTAMAPVDIAVPGAYVGYKLIFPTLQGGSTMQIGELQLYDAVGGGGAQIALTGQRAIAENSIPTGKSLQPTSPNPPETPRQAVDQNSGTKYLNWAGPGSGLIISLSSGAAVKSLKITTGNDAIPRDPTSYLLYGTMDAVTSPANGPGTSENWTLVGSSRIALPAGRGVTSGALTDPLLSSNSTAYTAYKIVFPTLGGDSLFQIADVQFYTDAAATSAGLLSSATPVRAIATGSALLPPNSAGSYFALYSGGPILPQGGSGTFGLYEQRANGNLKRPEGTITGTNATVYANDSPQLYARWGAATPPTAAQWGVANYMYARSTSAVGLDFGDDNSSVATGFNSSQTEFLTSSIGTAHDQFFQLAQGCFHVTAPGRYTFTLRGDDGAQFAIAGVTWVARYADNGNGSIVGEVFQNGFPTGDTAAIAVAEFPAAGCYNWRYMWNEQGGGAWNEVFYAQGERSAYDPVNFKQLTDSSGGLTLVDHQPIMGLESSSYLVLSGSPATITLSWDAAYCTSVTMSGGSFGAGTDVTAHTVNHYGSIAIAAPASTTTYTVTGVRGSGTPVSASVTVYVDSAPVITSFSLEDATVRPGDPIIFRWNATANPGTTFSITDGVNTWNVTPGALFLPNNTVNGRLPTGGIIPHPTEDTTYTITATNGTGTSAPAQVSVDVGAGPVLTLAFDRTTLLKGSATTLTWTASADAQNPQITPRLTTASLSTTVPLNGSQLLTPERTTTYTFSAHNVYGLASVTATVTMPERIGVDANGWTVQADYWNRFGYTDPVYGTRNSLAGASYAVEEMWAISDAALGARGPLAGTFTDNYGKTVAGPNPPPNAQPGTGEKVLMRFRQTGVASPNYQDAGGSSGFLLGDIYPPPSFTSGVTYDQYAIRATANLVVNVPGTYTIGINSDDGMRLRLDRNRDGDFNDADELLLIDETPRGFFSNPVFTAAVTLTPGSYPIEFMYFEQAGGSGGEVFWIDPTDNCARKHLPIISSAVPMPATTDVVISEFMAVNNQSLEDSEGNSPDWVELYNGTASAISLNGYYLSDNPAIPQKWAFPATASIPAGGYLIVFASGKASRINPPPPVADLHTNFTLGGGSGYIGLAKNNGGGYLTVSSYTYGDQRADISYGIIDGGPATGYIPWPTPAGPNMGGAASLVRGDTQFDVDRSIRDTPFNLTITADDTHPQTIIRYTIDGSTPTMQNGITYTGPIPISVTTVIRAAAFRPGAIPTNVDTQTYIFPADVLTQDTVTATSKGWPNQTVAGQYFDYGMDPAIVLGNEAEVIQALKAIPTVSMVTDITNLTDPSCGIFVESQTRGRAYERHCSIELINDTGNLLGNFQIDCGVRSRGGFSRNDNNPKHSWHLYFRNDPGYEGRLRYPVFGTGATSFFRQIDLATANNYSWSFSPNNGNIRTFNYTTPDGTATSYVYRFNTFLRDVVAHDLELAMHGLTTRNKYVHLYINGQYWGLHYLQERPESSNSSEYLGGDPDNYDVVKSGGNANTAATYRIEATEGDYAQGIMGTAAADGTYASAWAKLYGGALDLRQRNGTTFPTPAQNNDRNIRLYRLMGFDYTPATGAVVRNHAYPVLLDVNNLIDYMLLVFYCGAYDSPLSTFIANASNNWWGVRDRTGTRGFTFFAWDFEHGMGTDILSGDLTAGTSMDINHSSAVTDNRFVAATGAPAAGFRSTNRLGPWAGPSINPRYFLPTNQHFRATSATSFGTSNPEFYQSSDQYNNMADYTRSNPQYLHEHLCFAPEYRRMFADRAQCMLRQGGPLTTPRVLAAIDARKAQLENAIIAESARWGNAKGVALANYNKAAWLAAVQNIKDWVIHGSNQHLLNSLQIRNPAAPTTLLPGVGSPGPGRAEVIISQLRAYRDGGLANANTSTGPFWIVNGLFPGLDAPEFSSYGGVVPNGTPITITNPNGGGATGTLYYSTDGSDPRPLGGGAPASGALTVASGGSVTLTATGTLLSRVYDSGSGEWSAAAKADFVVGVPASASNLLITEINYNPRNATPGTPTAGDIQTFEFIELINTSSNPVDLTGVTFTSGISYTFPTGRVLNAGGRIVVAKDLAAFASRYPDTGYPGLSAKTVGPYNGNLDNGGERLTLKALDNSTIADFSYDDDPPWPTTPDGNNGNGATLVFRTGCGASNYGDALSWYGHLTQHGNPGGPDGDNYPAWAVANSASLDGNGDGDSDGISDLIEYLLGSNPSNSSSVGFLPTAGMANLTVGGNPGTYQTITYTRRIDIPDVAASVEVCDDLQAANWTATAVLVSRTLNANGTETLLYRAPLPMSADNRNFMRVRIVCDPIP